MCVWSHPQQPDYLTSFMPPPELRRTTSSTQDQRNRFTAQLKHNQHKNTIIIIYQRTPTSLWCVIAIILPSINFLLCRSGKYYPATFSHAPLELRPIKMKKSMKKSLGSGVVTREPGKMYTWSPYTSNLFYTEPTGGRSWWTYFLSLASADRCQGLSCLTGNISRTTGQLWDQHQWGAALLAFKIMLP